MTNPLTNFGWAVIVTVVSIIVTVVVGLACDWYHAIYPFCGGLLTLCIIGAITSKRGAA